MCHPQFGCPEESTQIDGSGIEQSLHAAIGAGNHQEASAALKLPQNDFGRRPPNGMTSALASA